MISVHDGYLLRRYLPSGRVACRAKIQVTGQAAFGWLAVAGRADVAVTKARRK
jgi:hypothetical protein